MKTLLTLVTIALGMNIAQASIECKDIISKRDVVSSKRLDQNTWFTNQEVKWSMIYLNSSELFDDKGNEIKTFGALREYFENYKWDELRVEVLRVVKTGKEYVEVYSYPGDNQYGVLIDIKTGRMIGSIEDSDYYINDEYCKWPEEDA